MAVESGSVNGSVGDRREKCMRIVESCGASRGVIYDWCGYFGVTEGTDKPIISNTHHVRVSLQVKRSQTQGTNLLLSPLEAVARFAIHKRHLVKPRISYWESSVFTL